jgi:hypothetical protein
MFFLVNKKMKVAIDGCDHIKLNRIYETMNQIETNIFVICGGFQVVRNEHDLQSMAVPINLGYKSNQYVSLQFRLNIRRRIFTSKNNDLINLSIDIL